MSQKESGKTLVFVGLLRSEGLALPLLEDADILLIGWLTFKVLLNQCL